MGTAAVEPQCAIQQATDYKDPFCDNPPFRARTPESDFLPNPFDRKI
jgi:hypothetical protein